MFSASGNTYPGGDGSLSEGIGRHTPARTPSHMTHVHPLNVIAKRHFKEVLTSVPMPCQSLGTILCSPACRSCGTLVSACKTPWLRFHDAGSPQLACEQASLSGRPDMVSRSPQRRRDIHSFLHSGSRRASRQQQRGAGPLLAEPRHGVTAKRRLT